MTVVGLRLRRVRGRAADARGTSAEIANAARKAGAPDDYVENLRAPAPPAPTPSTEFTQLDLRFSDLNPTGPQPLARCSVRRCRREVRLQPAPEQRSRRIDDPFVDVGLVDRAHADALVQAVRAGRVRSSSTPKDRPPIGPWRRSYGTRSAAAAGPGPRPRCSLAHREVLRPTLVLLGDLPGRLQDGDHVADPLRPQTIRSQSMLGGAPKALPVDLVCGGLVVGRVSRNATSGNSVRKVTHFGLIVVAHQPDRDTQVAPLGRRLLRCQISAHPGVPFDGARTRPPAVGAM